MATNTLLNVNARDWTAESAGFIPGDGEIFYYHSHPDYTNTVYIIGDGSTAFDSLFVYRTESQEQSVLYDFNNAIFNFVPVFGTAIGADQISCTVSWPKVPLQTATGVTIALPSSNLRFYNGAGAFASITAAHTISNLSILGSNVVFRINETGIGTAVGSGVSQMRVNGTGCSLTLS